MLQFAMIKGNPSMLCVIILLSSEQLNAIDLGHNIRVYRKRGKIRQAKHSCFSRSSNFSREYKRLSLLILNNKHFWPRQCENISAKTSMGLKMQTFSPANLSPSMVVSYQSFQTYSCFLKSSNFYTKKVFLSTGYHMFLL